MMSPETKPNIQKEKVIERLQESQKRFVDILVKYDFNQDVLDSLTSAVLPGLEYEYSEDAEDLGERERCRFFDVGTLEFGEPDGRYRIAISGNVLASRAGRLKGHVPEGSGYGLALDWMNAHELGHAVGAAYGLLHHGVHEGDISAGIIKPADATAEYLNKNPHSAMSDDEAIATTIERERQCEGFARLILIDGLIKLGFDNNEAKSIADKIYEIRATEAPSKIDPAVEDPWAAHKVGYSHPLTFDELVERFTKG